MTARAAVRPATGRARKLRLVSDTGGELAAAGGASRARREQALVEALRAVAEHEGIEVAKAIVGKAMVKPRGRPRAKQPPEGIKQALRYFAKHPDASLGKLAQIAGVTVPAISKRVKDPDVEAGLVVRLRLLASAQLLQLACNIENKNASRADLVAIAAQAAELEKSLITELSPYGIISPEEVDEQRRKLIEDLRRRGGVLAFGASKLLRDAIEEMRLGAENARAAVEQAKLATEQACRAGIGPIVWSKHYRK